ncbi:hypothetical protein E2C01_010912 [Portunus trituberculatus]|uniref:Uncharacterized protein n=1 Tax=Portunus trituberculatus TaxID=210409 RepID=A0A5B7D9P5_PORTR|nr:hypothetical protein [Portunus trituberculatus]
MSRRVPVYIHHSADRPCAALDEVWRRQGHVAVGDEVTAATSNQAMGAHGVDDRVIGGTLQERLIPVPYSKTSTDQAIRVVNAFRQGLDARPSNPNLAAVLKKQSSLNKRLSQGSSLEYADLCPDPEELTVPEIDEHSRGLQQIQFAPGVSSYNLSHPRSTSLSDLGHTKSFDYGFVV